MATALPNQRIRSCFVALSLLAATGCTELDDELSARADAGGSGQDAAVDGGLRDAATDSPDAARDAQSEPPRDAGGDAAQGADEDDAATDGAVGTDAAATDAEVVVPGELGAACSEASECAADNCQAGKCRPSCYPACESGETCGADDDCEGDDPQCDDADRVCTESCGPLSVASQAVLDAARYCHTVVGDLTISGEGMGIASSDLPYLRRITGDVNAGFIMLADVTLDRLETVEGEVSLGLHNSSFALRFPSLRSVGTATTPTRFQVVQAGATHVEAPQLETIHGELFVDTLGSLTTLDLRDLETISGDMHLGALYTLESVLLGSLSSVGGELSLEWLPALPYSAVQSIDQASIVTGTRTISEVGCCYVVDQRMCTLQPADYGCE